MYAQFLKALYHFCPRSAVTEPVIQREIIPEFERIKFCGTVTILTMV